MSTGINQRVEGCALIFSYENSKTTTWCWTTIDRMLDPTKKIPHVQRQRGSPKKTVGGAKSRLESNPIPARDAWRAQTKPWAHQEMPQSLRQTCLWIWVSPVEVWISSGLPLGQRPGHSISTFNASIMQKFYLFRFLFDQLIFRYIFLLVFLK